MALAVAADRVSPVRAGFHQPRPPLASRTPAGTPTRHHDRRTSHLRPTTTTHPRPDPPPPAHQPLPTHRARLASRDRAHPNPRTITHPALAAASNPPADFPRLHRALDNVRDTLDAYAKREGLAA
jgi:hypothetical protein